MGGNGLPTDKGYYTVVDLVRLRQRVRRREGLTVLPKVHCRRCVGSRQDGIKGLRTAPANSKLIFLRAHLFCQGAPKPMPEVTLAFVGYRQEWERDWIAQRVGDAVQVVGLPCDPADTILERAGDLPARAEMLVCWGFPLDRIHERPGRLKLLQCLAAGTDSVPKVELHRLGIPVAGNGGANSVAVAEWAVLLILAALRRLTRLIGDLHQGRYNALAYEWGWEAISELTAKRVGIVGFGRIGQDVALRLAGWGCELVYCDQRQIDPAREGQCNAARVSLDELMETSDAVTIHAPLTDRTRGMIGAAQIGRMKPTAVLVNTGRGPVVDEAALIAALQSGAIAGAGLDVTQTEPLPLDSPLLQMDNVFLTPHLAGLTMEARQKALSFAAENANRLAAGERPLGIVDPFE